MKLKGKIAEEFEEYTDWIRDNYESSIQLTREAFEQCESPMEQAFLLAFLAFGGFTDNVFPPHGEEGYQFFIEYQFDSFVMIEPQCKVVIDGRTFRADFLFLYRTRNPLTDHLRIIVEIDGHDFHERTKEQARRDRSRDRLMTKEGYTVFRFTGSEVYADAVGCAREVSAYIYGYERRLEEASGR